MQGGRDQGISMELSYFLSVIAVSEEQLNLISLDQIMNQSQKTNNTRLASRKEMRVTWLLAPLMSNRERKHSKRQKLSCFWVEVNIECGIGGGDDC